MTMYDFPPQISTHELHIYETDKVEKSRQTAVYSIYHKEHRASALWELPAWLERITSVV